jgi:hypothetical protein
MAQLRPTDTLRQSSAQAVLPPERRETMAFYQSRQTRRRFLKVASAVGASAAAYALGLVPELAFAGQAETFSTVEVSAGTAARRLRRLLASPGDAANLVAAQRTRGLALQSTSASALDWIHDGTKVGSTLLVPFSSDTGSSTREFLIWRESDGVPAVSVGSYEPAGASAYNMEQRDWDSLAGQPIITHTARVDAQGLSVTDTGTGATRSARWDDAVPAPTTQPQAQLHGTVLEVSANNCGACVNVANLLINTVGCTVVGWLTCLACGASGPLAAFCAIVCGSIIALICWYNQHGLYADAWGICRIIRYC